MSKKDISSMLAKKAREAGLDDKDLHHLATPEGGPLLDRFVDLMVQANNPFTPIKVVEGWKTSINYSNSLKKMAEEWRRPSGGSLHPDITQSRFFDKNMAGVVDVTLFLINFDTYTLNIEALAEFTRRIINPAGVAELFALSTAFPKIQHRSPVVALGKAWESKEGPHVTMLTNEGVNERSIVLGNGEPDYCWPGDTRFLAVRYW